MNRQLVVASAVTVLLASTASGELIYYAVSEGKGERWRVADRKEFESKRPSNVFDLYTFRRLSDGTATVHREISAPSGEWSAVLTYYYEENGRLRRMDFNLDTVNGVCPCGDTGPVRCERSYSVGLSGKLQKRFERVTDLRTGEIVDWTFREPTIAHWASVRALPIVPQSTR